MVSMRRLRAVARSFGGPAGPAASGRRVPHVMHVEGRLSPLIRVACKGAPLPAVQAEALYAEPFRESLVHVVSRCSSACMVTTGVIM